MQPLIFSHLSPFFPEEEQLHPAHSHPVIILSSDDVPCDHCPEARRPPRLSLEFTNPRERDQLIERREPMYGHLFMKGGAGGDECTK